MRALPPRFLFALAPLALLASAHTALGWGDDFNDNWLDPGVWAYWHSPDAALTEWNQRLEFTCFPPDPFIPTPHDASCELLYELPYDAVWTATTDVHFESNAHIPFFPGDYALGIRILNAADPTDYFELKHSILGGASESWELASYTDGAPRASTVRPTAADDGQLRIDWDGDFITAYYDEGAGFQQLPRLFIDDWVMAPGGTFQLQLFGSNFGGALVDGSKLYLDNFQLAPGPETFWTAGTGDWLGAGNWSDGLPAAQRDAHIQNGGTAQLAGGAAEASRLYIGTTGTGRLEWTGGTLQVSQIDVGPNGTMTVGQDWTYEGELSVSGGTVDIGANSLTLDNGGRATVTAGLLALGSGVLGQSAHGELHQEGGTVQVGQDLVLGSEGGTYGIYHLMDGNLDVRGDFVLGRRGGGETYQEGGRVVVSGDLSLGEGDEVVGYGAGLYGMMPMVPGRVPSLQAERLLVGNGGHGEFGQDGEVVVQDALWIGTGDSNSIINGSGGGSYYMMRGDLTVGNEIRVGNGAIGSFWHEDGNVVVPTMYLGYTGDPCDMMWVPEAHGRYELMGGNLAVPGAMYVGHYADGPGSGLFRINGGHAWIGTLNIGVEVAPGQAGPGTVMWSGSMGTLEAEEINIGPRGYMEVQPDANWVFTGRLNQRGGELWVYGMGLDVDGGGEVFLYDGNCRPGTLDVGASSVGAVTQAGGRLEADEIYVGRDEGSHGTLNLLDGTCMVAFQVTVGMHGTGVANHSGGELVTGWVSVAHCPNSVGTYNLSGTGRILSEWGDISISLGNRGIGTFNQSGGTVQVDSLYLGGGCSGMDRPYGTGTYNLTGGELYVRRIMQHDGYGTLIVDGGELINPDEPMEEGGPPPDVQFHYETMENDAHFTFGGTNGRLQLGEPGTEFYIHGRNTFTQTGGTVLAHWIDIYADPWGDPNARPSYTIADGKLLMEVSSGFCMAGIRVGDNGTFTQTGGTVLVTANVRIAAEMTMPVYHIRDGELIVQAGIGPCGSLRGGELRVGDMEGMDANGLLHIEGGTVTAGRLILGYYYPPEPEMPRHEAILRMGGGRLVITGRSGGPGEPWGTDSLIAGRLEGHGTITCAGELLFTDWATLAPEGGVLTIDGEPVSARWDEGPMTFVPGGSLHLPVDVPPGAGLRTRGALSGAVTNAGLLAAYGGDLRLTGPVVNTGTLANAPFGTLYVHSPSLAHAGSVEAYSEGGVSFDRPIVNQAGQSIALYGGTVAAPHITNAPGGLMTGTGTIHADLTNQGTTDFFADVRIFGDVLNEPGALIHLADGDLRIFGHTQNEGDIKILNGQAIFHGGYDGDGNLSIDPALAVIAADMAMGPDGVVTTDEFSTLQLRGDFLNASTRKADFDLSAGTVQLHGQGEQLFEAAGADKGASVAAWVENFAIGTLLLEPGSVLHLADLFDNQLDGAGNEAVYVDELEIKPGSAIVMDGIALYYLRGGDPATDGVPKRLFLGDYNLDGIVDVYDYLTYKLWAGTEAGAGWFSGDSDGDGDVDCWDFATLEANFNSVTQVIPAPGGAIPEPLTLLLLAAGAPLLARRRRR